jgi:hypothetical protein
MRFFYKCFMLLTFFFCLIGRPAFAEWQFLERNKYGDVYVDPQTLIRSGSLAKMWSAALRKQAMKTVPFGDIKNAKEYWSQKKLVEFDCYNKTLRVLETVYFSQKSLNGEVVDRRVNDYTTGFARLTDGLSWRKMDKYLDDSDPALWQFVCGR